MKKNRMRVLYVLVGYYLGGAEKGLLNLIDRGFFSNMDLEVLALWNGSGAIIDDLKDRGYEPKVLISENRLSLIDLLRCISRIKSLLKSNTYDVIILSQPLTNLVGRIALSFQRVPFLISFEHTTKYNHKLYYFLLYITRYRINGIFSDSKETLRVMRKQFSKEAQANSWIVPLTNLKNIHAIKIQKYQKLKAIKILSVGRLDKAKDYPTAFKVVRKLINNGFDVQYSIVGDGDEKSNLKQLALNLGVESHIQFLGSQKNWHKIAKEADIFLLTSRFEGLCIAMIEAMTLGMPCVSTDVGEIKFYGESGVNMLKSRPGDVDELVKHLTFLAQMPNERKQMSINARQDTLNIFGRKAVATIDKNIQRSLKKTVLENLN